MLMIVLSVILCSRCYYFGIAYFTGTRTVLRSLNHYANSLYSDYLYWLSRLKSICGISTPQFALRANQIFYGTV